MNKIQKLRECLSNFILQILKALFLILIISTIPLVRILYMNLDVTTFVVLAIYILTIIISYFLIRADNIKQFIKILSFIFIGLTIRILWNININAQPFSDFKTMYECANYLLHGDNSAFKDFGYIARFPHLSYMIVYMSFFIKYFKDPILVMKGVNIILSLIDMYLIYLISLKIFKREKLALISLSITSLYPPMIAYVGMLVTENIAIPFYLLSIYLLLKYIDNKFDFKFIFLSGILLGIGNLFRMVGNVVLVAYVIYILIYIADDIKNKIRKVALITVGFLIVLLLGNGALKIYKISEVNLWHGKEPNITSILKGSNIESGGFFNEKDANLSEKYNFDEDRIKEEAKEIIEERLTKITSYKLATFYIGKFISQWSEGDMSGTYWSESGAVDGWSQIGATSYPIKFRVSSNAVLIFQLFYSILIVFSFISLFNKKRISSENSEINLFYIIFCGFGILYLITEIQGRYAYIISFVFVILALSGIEHKFIKDKDENTIE